MGRPVAIHPLQVRPFRLVLASWCDERRGLLGYVSLHIGDLHVDGTLRRSGRPALSFSGSSRPGLPRAFVPESAERRRSAADSLSTQPVGDSMPVIDFDNAEAPIPPDRYLVEITGVDQGRTKAGAEMWTLRLVVQSGEYSGAEIWDRLVFSPAAMKRVRVLCAALGLDTSGQLALEPWMLKGKRVFVRTRIENYNGEDRTAVEFLGYEAAPEGERTPF